MMGQCVDTFVAQQRALGFEYRVQSSLLKNFAAYAQAQGNSFITTKTVLAWSAQAPSAAQKRNRLLTVRRLALSLYADNPLHQVPPADAFGGSTYRRRKPHIYTEQELTSLQQAAMRMTPAGSIRPLTFYTLITLLWVSGLRISEALSLNAGDITADGLLIRATKFRKNRLVPIHTSSRCALEKYLSHKLRQKSNSDSPVFISTIETRLSYSNAAQGFLQISRNVGLREGPGTRGPSLHNFRHSFAVRSLECCPTCPKSVQQHMVSLSTYLGHAHISDTYWYLEATPKLATHIAQLTEADFGEVQS